MRIEMRRQWSSINIIYDMVPFSGFKNDDHTRFA